ncbi:MAG: sulfatase-like hydrolase/transferase [Polyangiaceae bacterium]|nr:sulfatase-like hydrolase/transferase [Polyangiaceae bacterium]
MQWARWAKLALALVAAGQLAVLDVALRGPSAYVAYPRMLGGLVASLAFSLLVFSQFRGLVARAIVALITALLLVGQLAYYVYYHAPLDAQVALAARQYWADVRPVLVQSAWRLALATTATAGLELWLLSRVRLEHMSRPLLAGLAVAGWGLAGSPRQCTAEVRAAHAVTALLTTPAGSRQGARPAVPELQSLSGRLPDVLLIVTESVRASDGCQRNRCTTGRELVEALPAPLIMDQARSLASYTTVALLALVTGRTQERPPNELAQFPDLFDLARAARGGRERYSVYYWSAQLAESTPHGPLTGVADEVVTAETLLGHPLDDIEESVLGRLDRRVVDLCERKVVDPGEPRFIVVHLAGTHTPYFFEEQQATFHPWGDHITWKAMDRLHNKYLNALAEQDRTVARCARAFVRSEESRPWLVLYTSDHGEAFGENHAIHHGQNLFDEQIHVPMIMAHGGDALSPAQAAALREAQPRPVTHADLLPTLLDAMGLLDHFALRSFVASLPGRSLLRPITRFVPLPLTNCTDTHHCPLNTWGVLGEKKKLVAQVWDGKWRCMGLEGGERELDLRRCPELIRTACAAFPTLPSGSKNWPCR